MSKLVLMALLGVCSVFFSCNVISSNSDADQLKEQIIFASNRSASNNPGELGRFEKSTIHRMNPDGSGVAQITGLESNNQSHFEPTISYSGKAIAFSVRIAHENSDDEWYIYTSEYNGANMKKVAGTVDDRIINPRWSPTDSRIAFASNRFGNYDIFTVKPSGNDVVQITNGESKDTNPAWSPDGSKIAFTSNRDGDQDIYVKNLENDHLTRITNDDGSDIFPRWSPDGTKIAFTSDRDGDNEAFVTDAEGTNITQLTHNETSDTPFSWSPDGEKIVIITHRDGNIEVFKIDVSGESNPVNLSNNPATDWDPVWGHIKVSED